VGRFWGLAADRLTLVIRANTFGLGVLCIFFYLSNCSNLVKCVATAAAPDIFLYNIWNCMYLYLVALWAFLLVSI